MVIILSSESAYMLTHGKLVEVTSATDIKAGEVFGIETQECIDK